MTRIIAGPLSTQVLADLGATVYKIEKPGEGDDSRRMGPFMRDGGVQALSNESATFLAYNRGKHSVTVDIATHEGAALIRELAAHCDIVVENYKAGGLKKYQLDYASLCEVKPDIIYCSITGFGQDGPYAARPAYDFILQGMAGPMSTCGLPDGEQGAAPMRTSIPITDITTGLYATIAMISALYHHRQTGEGQFIDAALLDAAVSFNGHLSIGYLMTGVSPKRAGNTNPIAAPADVYPCKDGYLIIAAGNNGQFNALCKALGLQALAADPRFSTNPQRIANRALMQQSLLPETVKYTKAQLLTRLEQAGVPSGPINNMGLPMARNLLRAGLSVTGFDLVKENVAQLVSAGGVAGQSLAQAVGAAKVVISMLPTSQHVIDVYCGEHGVFAAAKPGTLLIDSSTIAPKVAQENGRLAAEHGMEMIDAPVSGGNFGAAAATLTFMVGGSEKGFNQAQPYLQKMGKAIYHAGPHGSGQTVKVCNNMLLGITMIGTAEALRLGIANGMDPKVLTDIISKSSGNNWALTSCNPCPGVMEQAPASNGYAGGFGVDLMLKDLGLAVENALDTKSSVPLGSLARNIYDMHSKAGNGKLDYGSIFKMLGD